MLAFTWIALRFIHFTSLMLVFGFAMYGDWLTLTIRRLLTKRFLRLQQHAAVWSLIKCHCNARRSGRVDGNGMDRCIFAKHLAGCLRNTVWWGLVMANCSRPRNVDRRPYATAEYATFAVYAHYRAIYSAGGSGHATLNEGVTAKIHQTNHAIHLICAAAWLGDYCRCSGVCNSSKAVGDTRLFRR